MAARRALSDLCEAYWTPVYTFIRQHTAADHDAEDLTQAFFTQLLDRPFLHTAEPAKGRFRSFLLGAVRHFLSNERNKVRTIKRGGQSRTVSLTDIDCVAEGRPTAEQLFERQWAVTLLTRVLDRLETEQSTAGRGEQFEVLRGFLDNSYRAPDYAEAASRLGLSNDAVRVSVHRLRRRYRILLREEISLTTAAGDDVDDELKSLFQAVRRF
ncbi:MAG: sigma-70 family RNA polymerase sigma factor [Planctomycetaceae bacterium]